MVKLVAYMINDQVVTAPDEEQWAPIVVGTNLNNLQVRSSYWELTWAKQVAGKCMLDWFTYDQQTLTSLTARKRDSLDEVERFTDVVCTSVTAKHARENMTQVTAKFIVGVP